MPALMTVRRMVDPTDCDFLGHMNVSKYFATCSDAVGSLQSELGLTSQDICEGRRLSFAVVRAESDFKAELHAGDVIYMMTDILELGTKSATFRHRLYRGSDKTLAFETLFKAAMFNLGTRRAEAIPEDVREKALAYMAD